MNIRNIVKRDIVISAVTILLLIIGTTFTAYSLFFRVDETTDEVVDFGDLKVSYSTGSDTITRTADYPRTTLEGQETLPYVFTIENTGTLRANYNVLISDDTKYMTENNLLKVDDAFMNYQLNTDPVKLLNSVANNSLATGVLEVGQKVTYSVKFWLKEDAPNDAIGKSMVKKLQVKAEYVPEK